MSISLFVTVETVPKLALASNASSRVLHVPVGLDSRTRTTLLDFPVNMLLTIIRSVFSEVFICSVLLNLFNILHMFSIFEQHNQAMIHQERAVNPDVIFR